MREQLLNAYEKLFEEYGFEQVIDAKKVTHVLKGMLREFLRESKKPAIYGNGGHTKMLMSDFMFELKKVNVIIDTFQTKLEENGFLLIKDDQIEEEGIDSVIISSYKFRKDIAERLRQKHPTVRVLDIYDVFEKNGIHLMADYYYNNHPHHHYHMINKLQGEIEVEQDSKKAENLYMRLISQYLHIKDFKTAKSYADQLYGLYKFPKYEKLCNDLDNLYDLQMKAFAAINQNNVLLFCMDGLRFQDLSYDKMPNLKKHVVQKGFCFQNAYSFSTSTFESLIPVYSENGDLRTGYYRKNVVPSEKCRFIQEARQQDRQIFFYTDMDHFIEDGSIHYSEAFATVTEKIWSFLLDAVDEKNGLFYIHELYETHYSFSNPYTRKPLLAEGTAMLFDYLPQKGGKLRTDYVGQHDDSLTYMDQVVVPFLKSLQCNVLLYADHGNLVLEQGCLPEDVPPTKLICDNEWIQIPYVIFSKRMMAGETDLLYSLMSLNEIVICLLKNEKYEVKQSAYVKIARSELYNPDFRFLYKKWGQEQKLLAFECFVFENGYKLVIYSNGKVELYREDQIVTDADSKVCMELIETVKASITVCDKIIEDNRVCE